MLTFTFAYTGRVDSRQFEVEIDENNVNDFWSVMNDARLELQTWAPLGRVDLIEGIFYLDSNYLIPGRIMEALWTNDPDAIHMMATFIAAECDVEAFLAYSEVVAGCWSDESPDDFLENYMGCWEDWEDFAHNQLLETDESYSNGNTGCRGWMPKLDEIAWRQDYSFVEVNYANTYVFANH